MNAREPCADAFSTKQTTTLASFIVNLVRPTADR
jgi:hypothetical protein